LEFHVGHFHTVTEFSEIVAVDAVDLNIGVGEACGHQGAVLVDVEGAHPIIGVVKGVAADRGARGAVQGDLLA